MAVTLPSDLVLDVMNAAAPQQVREARDALAAKASARTAAAFEAVAKPAETAAAISPPDAVPAEARQAGSDLQAVLLQNLFKEMLPPGTTLGGSGLAGDMWESMFVENIAKAAAERDVLGLSTRLLADVVEAGDSTATLEGARDFRSVVRESQARDVSSALLASMQRAALDTVTGGEG